MFDWQRECLSNRKVLFENSNLVYCAPTSAGLRFSLFLFAHVLTQISYRQNFGQRNSLDKKCAGKTEESSGHSSICGGGPRKDEILTGTPITATHNSHSKLLESLCLTGTSHIKWNCGGRIPWRMFGPKLRHC